MPRSALLYQNEEILQFSQQFGLQVRPRRVRKGLLQKTNFATATTYKTSKKHTNYPDLLDS